MVRIWEMATGIRIDGTPTDGENPWIDSLVWGGAWTDSDGGVVTIKLHRGIGYDSTLGARGLNWTSTEKARLENALKSWEKVANIDFVYSNKSSADAVVMKLSSAAIGSNFLGFAEPAGYALDSQNYMAFNGHHFTWKSGLNPGGYGFVTLVHEIGHLLGLAHPHDGGAASDGTTFPGVTGAFGSYGQHDLNQGIFTTMSYNDGWATEYPNHGALKHGWQATPMALDIAAVQAIYGANMDHATGNNTYKIPVKNGSGTAWRCIWDAGGEDTLSYDGKRACTINLNDAPLVGPDAGGYVSYAPGIVGGFTIANGVIIENARGGNGRDTIIGNEADNTLNGRGGSDTIEGGDGDDLLIGAKGADYLDGGNGDDLLYVNRGNSTFIGGAGNDTVEVRDKAGAKIDLSVSTEQATGIGLQVFQGIENAIGGRGNDILTGTSGANVLTGNFRADTLIGGAGADTLVGGVGRDTMFAGVDSDQDVFVFRAQVDSKVGAYRDTIHEFDSGEDLFDLTGIDANRSTKKVDDEFVFSGTTAAANSVWYEVRDTDALVRYDNNGDGRADGEFLVTDVTSLDAGDFLL